MKIDIKFHVTDFALSRLKTIFSGYVRVTARSLSSHKISYELAPVGSVGSADIVEDISGVRFVVDRVSLLRLEGVKLDWVSAFGEEGFLFFEPGDLMSCRS